MSAQQPDAWAEHRWTELRDVARRSTPAQRLAWLEEALRIAHASGALAKARADRDTSRVKE
jgi:hypothetical protein